MLLGKTKGLQNEILLLKVLETLRAKLSFRLNDKYCVEFCRENKQLNIVFKQSVVNFQTFSQRAHR